MGDDIGVSDERSAQRVHLEGYWIGKFPMTNAFYQRFAAQAGYKARGAGQEIFLRERGTIRRCAHLSRRPCIVQVVRNHHSERGRVGEGCKGY